MTLSLPDAFFRDSTNPMWVFDESTLQIFEVNSAACKRYGYTREEFLKISLLELRSPEEQELTKSGAPRTERVWEHRTKSGERLYIRGYNFPFVIEGRRAILAVIVDVTNQVRLEREKADLLRRYEILTEAANDLLWDWDLATDMVTHNEALISQYGYDRSELQSPIGWWSDKIHPDDFNVASWSIQEAIRERRRYWTAEYRLKKADGSYVLVLDRGILHTDENDQPIRMIGSIVDLTTRRAAEDERNQLFRLSADSMLFLDPSGQISQANAAFHALAGFEPDPAVKRSMQEFLGEADRTTYEGAVRKTLEEGAEGHFTTSIAVAGRQGKTIEWAVTTNEPRNRLFLIGRDITESKAAQQRLEEALARSQELAIEAQAARQAQTEFLQNMSHELRTPMNGMLGTAQLLAGSATDDKQRNLANVLVSSGESLLQIVNDILDFSKIESGKITIDQAPFRLSDAIRGVFELFSLPAKQKGLSFTVSIAPTARVTVIGDQFRVRQVVSNLVGNAIKFTDQGSVKLNLDVEPAGESSIEARIRVRDSGIGVPSEMREQIFERFVQADSSPTRRHGGTGLGLSITQTVIGLMGGQISVKSKVGKGSEFVIRIPFEVVDTPEAALSPAGPATMPVRPGAKVLIAEDVVINAMILTNWLEQRGFECTTAATGYQAIDIFAKEPFDGAFIDLHMPDASGYDVVREIRASERGTDKHVPLVAVTASVSAEERRRCLEEGFDDYIPKPILVAELDRVITRLF